VGEAVGGDDLAECVVTPDPAWDFWEGGAAGGDSGELADCIYGRVVIGNDFGANFVLLGVEDVTVGFVGVGGGMDGAGDGG
jgi:hypothetical protein